MRENYRLSHYYLRSFLHYFTFYVVEMMHEIYIFFIIFLILQEAIVLCEFKLLVFFFSYQRNYARDLNFSHYFFFSLLPLLLTLFIFFQIEVTLENFIYFFFQFSPRAHYYFISHYLLFSLSFVFIKGRANSFNDYVLLIKFSFFKYYAILSLKERSCCVKRASASRTFGHLGAEGKVSTPVNHQVCG